MRGERINGLRRFLFRVGWPFVGQDLNVTDGRPPDVLPWPPPCGWSTGFIATPRTDGRNPSHRERPAFSRFFEWNSLTETTPKVALDRLSICRLLPDGRRTVTYFLLSDLELK